MPYFISNNIHEVNNELLTVINEQKSVDASDLDRLIARVKRLSSQALPTHDFYTLGRRVHELAQQIGKVSSRQKIAARLHEVAETAIRASAQQVPPAAVGPTSSLFQNENPRREPAQQVPPAAVGTAPSFFQDEDPRFESVVHLNQWLWELNHGKSTLQGSGFTEAVLKELIEKIKQMKPMPLNLPLYGTMLSKNLLSLAAHVETEFGNHEIVVQLLALATGKPVEEMDRIYASTPKPPRGVPRLCQFVDLTDEQLTKLADAFAHSMEELVIESTQLTQAAASQIERFTNLRKLVINGSIETSPTLFSLNLARCPHLEHLHIYGCQALVGLNLEECHQLKEVKLSSTGLKTLKFSESSPLLKRVSLVSNPSLQKVQLPEQANSLESFGLSGPTDQIDLPLIAPNLQDFSCTYSNVTALSLPNNSHKISNLMLRENLKLATMEWPSKDRHRKEPCLAALEKFDCTLTQLSDLSALASAEKLRILQVNANPQVRAVDLTRSSVLEYAEFINCTKLESLKLYPSLPGLRWVRIVLSPKLTPDTVTRLEGDPWKVLFEKHDRDTIAARD